MEIRRIAVIGAGLMGHGIAQDFATHGYPVTLTDVSPERARAALDTIRENLELLARHDLVTAEAIPDILARIQVRETPADTVRDADLVIEAATENLDLKRELFRTLDESAPPHAILASNTSTYRPSDLAAATGRPERVAIAHYFNPPYLLPLVEIVPGEATAPEVIETLRNLYSQMGKQPVVLGREILGFIGNRLQFALLREALALVDAGIATPADIDTVVRTSFGRRLPVTGVFQTFDLGGADTYLSICGTLFPSLDCSTEPSRRHQELVTEGRLGVKSLAGWYNYTPEEAAAIRRRLSEALIAFAQRKG